METLGNAAKICLLLSILSYFPSLSEGIEATWTSSSSVNGLEGQSVNMTWAIDFVNYPSGTKWLFVKISQDPSKEVISYTNDGRKTVFGDFQSREADLTLYVSQNGTIVTVVFTMANLNKTTDQNGYRASVTNLYPDTKTVATSTMLTVLVSVTITSPNPQTVTVNETQTAQLLCTATGNPPPSFNWTRNGVTVSTGSPSYTTPATTFNDDKTCYTCIAYNGVLEAKTANVCLNVQYKSRNATLSSDKTTVCQDGKVNLTCTSGPANPAPSSYEFYNNGVLVGTSAYNVYEATATAGLPDVNKLVCVPRNLLGRSVENGSVEVTAKGAPLIANSPRPKSVVEGQSLTLFCNATGLPVPNITWTKVGGSTIGSGETFTIASVVRGDEGSYRCRASNGDECSSATADALVTVNAISHPDVKNPGSAILKPKEVKTKDFTCVSYKQRRDVNKTVIATLGGLFASSLVFNIIVTAYCIHIKGSNNKLLQRSDNKDNKRHVIDIPHQETPLENIGLTTLNSAPEYDSIETRELALSNPCFPEYEAASTSRQLTNQPSAVMQTNDLSFQKETDNEEVEPSGARQTQNDQGQLLTSSTYQTIQLQTGNYGSLSPLTKLPPKNPSSFSSNQAGEYQALQQKGSSSQYQSLDELSRC